MTIETLSIDLETKSSENINVCGVYKYTESADFDILLFGVSINRGPVFVYDLACGETMPDELLAALSDEQVIKYAYNASFERICLSAWLRKNHPQYFIPYEPGSLYLSPKSWRCTMVWGAYDGLPFGLERAGAVLNLPEQKLKEGKELIQFFCCPCKPTKANGERTWNLPEHAPDKWNEFKKYNERDVEVEMTIQERLQWFPMPDSVWSEYHLDQIINDRGIMIDHEMAAQALKIDVLSREELLFFLKEKTGLANPNSATQMKAYLEKQGIKTASMGKKDLAAAMKSAPEDVVGVLSAYQQLSKTSVRKYQTMLNVVCADGRCHGMFQFYGANRSGRWSSKIIQLQNLPQNHIEDLDKARALVKAGEYTTIKKKYSSIPDVLSELIRSAFIPRPGYKFIVSDFSAIEARVLSFLADEKWRVEVFHNGRDIYCESASRMFGVPVEKNGQNAHLRQKGKVAELGLGFGGSAGALKNMGALEMGLKEIELKPLVDAWREANPHIVAYWWAVDDAAKKAIKLRKPYKVGNIIFHVEKGMLFITLPSGRRLAYAHPRIEPNKFGGESVTYMGIDATKHWSTIESYGPKFVENIVQGTSRDILAYAMGTLRDRFICGHVHDELIIECPVDTTVGEICEQMGKTPPWLPGIELRADGYECMFYQKQ